MASPSRAQVKQAKKMKERERERAKKMIFSSMWVVE